MRTIYFNGRTRLPQIARPNVPFTCPLERRSPMLYHTYLKKSGCRSEVIPAHGFNRGFNGFKKLRNGFNRFLRKITPIQWVKRLKPLRDRSVLVPTVETLLITHKSKREYTGYGPERSNGKNSHLCCSAR